MSGVLVHEWIATRGGSENVLEAMGRIYPDADIYCLWNDSGDRFDRERVHETWLARSPLRRSKAAALPLMPATWRGLRSDEFDWALISSHLFAHHVTFGKPDMPRFVYVHTPARYIWNPELDERGRSLPVRMIASTLKGLDRRRAGEGAQFAANSEFVRARIGAAWGAASSVIYPPVDVTEIQSHDWVGELDVNERSVLDALPAGYLLGASRFIPYKRLDLVIRAGEVSGHPVVIAGAGPEEESLRRLASASSVEVSFVIDPSNALLRALYGRALAYVFPAIEDFGIMPVEAMAAGTPVVGQRVGGAAESIVDGEVGALTTFESDAEIAAAVARTVKLDRGHVREHARRFSRERFEDEIRGWVGA